MTLRYDPAEQHTSLRKGADGAWTAEGRAIGNVDDPVYPQDVATRAYVDSGTASIAAYWKYQQQTTIADPGSGNLRMNQGNPHLATVIALSTTTDTGADASAKLAAALPGDVFEVQRQDDRTQWVRFELSAAPTSHGAWSELAVTFVAGTNPAFQNNARVAVRVLQTMVATRALLLALQAAAPGWVK